MSANQWVDQICPGTDIQDSSLLRNNTATVVSKKVGKVVNVISTPRYRWAEKAFWNIPVRHTVKMRQQGFVQHFNCHRISKVHRRLARRRLDDIVLQWRAALA